MDVTRFLKALWRWAWLIVLSTALAGVLSYRTTSQMPRVYSATTTLTVGQVLSLQNPTYGDFSTSQQLAQTYAQMVRYRPVLQATVDALRLSQSWESLAQNVNGSAEQNTYILRVTALDTDPTRAAAIANEVARQLIFQSPSQQDREAAQQREFSNQQMKVLQTRIDEAQRSIDQLQDQMAQETSALAIRDIQSQITARQEQVTSWQATYARLADFYRGGANTLSVLEPARVPTRPIAPDVLQSLALAMTVGFLLAVFGALIIEYLDDTLKTADDIASALGLPTIGSVGRIRGLSKPSDSLIGLRDPRAHAAEAYRSLRTNILFACLGESSLTLLVTSAGVGEGKSVTAANLAVSFAQSDRRTIIVDADLRRPTIHFLFGIPNDSGLTSLFMSELALPTRPQLQSPAAASPATPAPSDDADGELRQQVETALLPTVLPNLRVMCSGPMLPVNPAEPLSSRWMARLMASLQSLADVVILDTPPALPVADVGILAAYATRVVLVVESGKTRAPAARLTIEALQRMKVRLLGVVLNRVAAEPSGYYLYKGNAPSSRRQSPAIPRRDRATPP